MTPSRFVHAPVLAEEVVEVLGQVPPGVVLDATLGGGGHAELLLDAAPHLDVVGIDRDPEARAAAADRLARFADRVRILAGRFDALGVLLSSVGVGRLSGFLFDLGVSSPQLDQPRRGFSFHRDGPLDMRMDPAGALTADEVVNTWSTDQLTRALRRGGDERHAERIARAIVAARPIHRTLELADAVAAAIPAAARRRGGHPAKRTFQAIRIAVNDELEILEPSLRAALDLLVPGGRGAVITYHSGEDRIVKGVFRHYTTSDAPPGLPVPAAPPPFEIVRPAVRRPTVAEQEANRRSRSARLRVIQHRPEAA